MLLKKWRLIFKCWHSIPVWVLWIRLFAQGLALLTGSFTDLTCQFCQLCAKVQDCALGKFLNNSSYNSLRRIIIFRENHVSGKKPTNKPKQQVSDLLFYTLTTFRIRNPCIHFFILQSGNSIQIRILCEIHESIDKIKIVADGIIFFNPIIPIRFQTKYEQISGHPAWSTALTTEHI